MYRGGRTTAAFLIVCNPKTSLQPLASERITALAPYPPGREDSMKQDNDRTEPGHLVSRLDPRMYQIASLSILLFYGLLRLHFDVPVWLIGATIGVALLTQYAGTRLANLPCFDPQERVDLLLVPLPAAPFQRSRRGGTRRLYCHRQ